MLYGAYERRLLAQLRAASDRLPRHVAVITDGNRRWAHAEGRDSKHGHEAGAGNILELLRWCEDLGIKVVTLYVLSTDNLKRSAGELANLSEIISDMVTAIAKDTHRVVHPVGNLDPIPAELRSVLELTAAATAQNSGLHVNIAVGYGGRQEIVDAMRSLLLEESREGRSIDEIAAALTPEKIGAHLYTRGQPDPDLVIRTSGEQRLSGFLVWQSAYSEFYFHEAHWPDFRRVDFLRALRTFLGRDRRFGA